MVGCIQVLHSANSRSTSSQHVVLTVSLMCRSTSMVWSQNQWNALTLCLSAQRNGCQLCSQVQTEDGVIILEQTYAQSHSLSYSKDSDLKLGQLTHLDFLDILQNLFCQGTQKWQLFGCRPPMSKHFPQKQILALKKFSLYSTISQFLKNGSSIRL